MSSRGRSRCRSCSTCRRSRGRSSTGAGSWERSSDRDASPGTKLLGEADSSLDVGARALALDAASNTVNEAVVFADAGNISGAARGGEVVASAETRLLQEVSGF